MSNFKILSTRCIMHQVGLKVYGSQNFSFLAIKGVVVGVAQICITTARDRLNFFFA
jgi:hypothetical protein